MEKWSVVIAANASEPRVQRVKSAGPSVGGLGARGEGVRGLESIGISSAHFVAVVDSIPRVVAIEQSRAGELSSRGFEGEAPVSSPLAFSLSISLSPSPPSCPPSTTDSKIVVRCFCERGTRVRHVIACTPVLSSIFPFPSRLQRENTGEFCRAQGGRKQGASSAPDRPIIRRERIDEEALGTRSPRGRHGSWHASNRVSPRPQRRSGDDVRCRRQSRPRSVSLLFSGSTYRTTGHANVEVEKIASLQASCNGLPSPPAVGSDAGSVVVSSTRESRSQTRTFLLTSPLPDGRLINFSVEVAARLYASAAHVLATG